MNGEIGPVGVCLPVTFTAAVRADEQRAAVRALEGAGIGAAWVNEVPGKDALAQLAVLLAATGRMAFGTCVANVWARPPQTMHGAAAQLADAFPGRFTLGLGVGYPQQAELVGRDFGRPLATMRDYVAGMAAPAQVPAPDAAYLRLLAANGPRMLALAGEIADGALPFGLPPEHTARARRLLGPDRLLVVGQSVVLDDDRDRAREAARAMAAAWSARPSFESTMAGLGYPPGETDRTLDALVAHGGPDAVAAAVRAHLAAGADHVTLQQPIGTDFGTGIDNLVRLAPALAEVG